MTVRWLGVTRAAWGACVSFCAWSSCLASPSSTPKFSRTGEGSQAREPLSHRERGWGEGRRDGSVDIGGAPRIGISVLPLRSPSSALRAPSPEGRRDGAREHGDAFAQATRCPRADTEVGSSTHSSAVAQAHERVRASIPMPLHRHPSGFARASRCPRTGTRLGSRRHPDALAQAPEWVRAGTPMPSRRHPSGFARASRYPRPGTRAGSSRHPDALAQAPKRVRAGTPMPSRRHRGGFEQAPRCPRAGTEVGSRRHSDALAQASGWVRAGIPMPARRHRDGFARVLRCPRAPAPALIPSYGAGQAQKETPAEAGFSRHEERSSVSSSHARRGGRRCPGRRRRPWFRRAGWRDGARRSHATPMRSRACPSGCAGTRWGRARCCAGPARR